jgi:hypothetical protein
MCWQCENPEATQEDYFDELRRMIRAHGWAVQCVEEDRRPFAYTIGLHAHAMPELLVTGLAPHDAGRLLNWAAAHSVQGLGWTAGQQLADPGGTPIEVVDVEWPDAHLKFAVALGGRGVRAQQLVWADSRGRWPWQAGWGHGRRRQPVLGVRSAAA